MRKNIIIKQKTPRYFKPHHTIFVRCCLKKYTNGEAAYCGVKGAARSLAGGVRGGQSPPKKQQTKRSNDLRIVRSHNSRLDRRKNFRAPLKTHSEKKQLCTASAASSHLEVRKHAFEGFPCIYCTYLLFLTQNGFLEMPFNL